MLASHALFALARLLAAALLFAGLWMGFARLVGGSLAHARKCPSSVPPNLALVVAQILPTPQDFETSGRISFIRKDA